ncbi:MAG: shikimate dehydrogenase [Acidobacteriaceae bacterium]
MSFTPNLSAARQLRLRLPKVCVAVTGADPNELVEKAEGLVSDNSFLEFRLDYLKNPVAAFPRIRKFLETRTDAVVIATCRRAQNGGKFKGSLSSQLDVLLKAGAAGCQIVDIELESAEALKPGDLDKLRGRAAMLLSFHDFKRTRKIDDIFARMKPFAADFYKLVTTATSLYDNVLMMKFLQENHDRYSLVGLCMGEQGIISRVLGLRAGSVFTFAAAGRGEETGPGQITAQELHTIYRIDTVDAATRVYGVAGDPVEHSLSPVMMNAAFRREAVNAVYLALHAKKLDDLISCAREIPLSGFSVTMPYKEEIIAKLDKTDAVSAQIGATNTVVRGQDGRLFGFNTDVPGVTVPLEERLSLAGAKVLVLGAGGAARAAVHGVKSRGAEVFILNRTPAEAQKLARKAHAKTIKRTDLAKLQFDVIINATPVGMGGNGNGQSLLSDKELKARYVFDMVYNPLETKLLALAKSKGLHTISGVEMFVQQGARQFEIWTGKPAPISEMRYAVTRELENRAAAAAKANGKTKKK